MEFDEIDRELLAEIGDQSLNPAPKVRERFGISKQAITKRLQKLVEIGAIERFGAGRGTTYRKVVGFWEVGLVKQFEFTVDEIRQKGEDKIYIESIAPYISGTNKNADEILQHVYTEMLNNAMDHSLGKRVRVELKESSTEIHSVIEDDGMGVFESLYRGLQLRNLNEAVTELLKGKRTTDPENHAGEGCFFSMRLSDVYQMDANGILLTFDSAVDDFAYQKSPREQGTPGTRIEFLISKTARREIQEVFLKFTNEDFQFVKGRPFHTQPYTIAPQGRMVSRSEAKRFIASGENMESIIIDFKEVEAIGQGFADEIFRVWANRNPNVEINFKNANQFVRMMIMRTKPGFNVKET